MKKTVLVLGVLLSVGFAQVSCNRDDGLPTEAVAVVEDPVVPADPDPVDPVVEEVKLPAGAQNQLNDILHQGGAYTTQNAGHTYEGVTVKGIVKKDPADTVNGHVYYVELSNGIVLGYGEDSGTEEAPVANLKYAEDPSKTGFKYSIFEYATGSPVEKGVRNVLGVTKPGYADSDANYRYINNTYRIDNRLDKTTEILFTNGDVAVFNSGDGSVVSFKDKDGKDLPYVK